MAQNLSGIVIKSTGSWYQVLPDAGGAICQCRTVGKMRLSDLPLTNPIAVGDHVEYTIETGEQTTQGNISKVLPRKNYVLRASPRNRHELHMIAANIDQALLVTTIVEPTLKPGFIDRYLLTTETHQIPVIIVFNKADIYDAEDMARFHETRKIYEDIGHQVLLTSSATQLGIDTLKTLIRDKTTLLTGQSGVGKSTLINLIEPDIDLRTGELSDHSGKGQHTTTFAEMFLLQMGGRMIDTPGIKSLSFNHLEPEHIAHNFREFFALSPQCRFGASCMHVNEPQCAVKAALEAGTVSFQRFDSYLNILAETQDQKYWERKKPF
jgi:ribosome biogenesis GTPase / thiamine phosphate phosphatase